MDCLMQQKMYSLRKACMHSCITLENNESFKMLYADNNIGKGERVQIIILLNRDIAC